MLKGEVPHCSSLSSNKGQMVLLAVIVPPVQTDPEGIASYHASNGSDGGPNSK